MLNRLYDRYGVTVVRRGIAGVLILLAGIMFFVVRGNDSLETGAEERKVPVVTLSAVRDLSNESTFSIVGTMSAVNEARLQAETSGRITSVNVGLGDTVYAGAIIGTIENSSEYASLLQAQGAYDSAVASSLQSGSSLEEARVAVRNIYRNAFADAEDVIRNLTDDFFQNPTSRTRGFRLGGSVGASAFNESRGEIETILTTWSNHIATNYEGLSEEDMLKEAESGIITINDFTAGLALIIADYDANTYFTEEKLAVYKTRLAGARTSLDGTLSSISATRSAYNQALISASPDTTSQSTALLKSALGTLRSAQANYEKTIVRTPISGTVNALYLKQGEYISNGQPTVTVANNGSLEITTAVGEKDFAFVHIGDVVRINNIATGTITKIAPAVDPMTGKSEVKISTENTPSLKNGSTVSIELTQKTSTENTTSKIVIPLKALKMLASGSVVFKLSDTNTLVALPVSLGAIRGDSVEVTSGLAPDTIIITDARGLKAGDSVTVLTQ
jgi:RND family efflux transporter MFP subunit